MNKKITNKSTDRYILHASKRIATPTIALLGFASLVSMFVFGYSHLLLLAAFSSSMILTGSYVTKKIKSSANLVPTEKSTRQKLISLKFKLDQQYSDIIEQTIEFESRVSKNLKLLENTLKQFFSPTEITYNRYFTSGSSALNKITINLELISEKLTTLEHIKSEENKTKIMTQINEQLKHIESLFEAFEQLIMSFEECKLQSDSSEIFEQLEQLAKRTEKYIKPN